MPTVTFPYETLKRLRLVSLDPLVLEIAGQHVKFRTIVTNDAGEVVSDMESEAKPVSVGEIAGLKLDDFEPSFHAAALRSVEQHEATIAAKDDEITANAKDIASKDAELSAKTAEHAVELAARQAREQEAAQLAEQLAAKAAELVAKGAEQTTKEAELVAQAAIAAAAKALAEKAIEVVAEEDDAAKAAKQQEADQLAVTLAAKDAALAFIKLPEKERQNAEKRAQIAKLQAEIDAAEVGDAKS